MTMDDILEGLLLINDVDVYARFGAFLAEKSEDAHENYDSLMAAPKTKEVPNYMSGVNIDDLSYTGSMGAPVNVTLRNWYMEDWFGEDRIRRVGEAVTAVVIVACIVLACGGWLR